MPARSLSYRNVWLAFLSSVAALFGGCSSSGDAIDVTDLDLPTLANLGGPVLTAPRVQPIYFPSFPYAADIDTFLQHLATSTYWPAVVSEYGVGPLTAVPGYATNVALPTAVTDTQLKDLLPQVFTEGSATLGTPRVDTIYALFLSPASTLTAQGQPFCGSGDPAAYHDEWTVSGTHVAVAIIPACPNSDEYTSLTGVDVLTPNVSHELVEAATDPFANSNPAYSGIDIPHILWAIAMNGTEVADLCENERPNLITPSDIGHPVQRIWSNDSAKAGLGPCVPVPAGEVYFNAVAEMPTTGKFFDPTGMSYTLPAMNAKIGEAASARISFRGGPSIPSTMSGFAFEVDDASSISLERPTRVTGARGQSVAAPVATSGAKAGLLPLVIAATNASQTAVHFWVGGINRN